MPKPCTRSSLSTCISFGSAVDLVSCLQEVMERTGANKTQTVLLGGVVFSVLIAVYCLWSKVGRPVPWTRIGSPGRRGRPSRRPVRQHV